jgi:hypothetical protein
MFTSHCFDQRFLNGGPPTCCVVHAHSFNISWRAKHGHLHFFSGPERTVLWSDDWWFICEIITVRCLNRLSVVQQYASVFCLHDKQALVCWWCFFLNHYWILCFKSCCGNAVQGCLALRDNTYDTLF